MVAGRKGCGRLRRETANHRGRALRRHSQLLRLQVTHQASDARTDLEWQPTLLLGRGNVVRMDPGQHSVPPGPGTFSHKDQSLLQRKACPANVGHRGLERDSMLLPGRESVVHADR